MYYSCETLCFVTQSESTIRIKVVKKKDIITNVKHILDYSKEKNRIVVSWSGLYDYFERPVIPDDLPYSRKAVAGISLVVAYPVLNAVFNV